MVWPRTVVGVYTLYSHNGKRRVCENSEASTRWHHGYFYPTTASFSHHNWRTGWMHYRVTSFELFLQLSYVIVFMPPPENDWLTEALCSHATCPFSVFLFFSFVCLYTIFRKRLNRFWCQFAQMVHGTMARNDKLWGSWCQRSRSHEVEHRFGLEAWRRHHSRFLSVE